MKIFHFKLIILKWRSVVLLQKLRYCKLEFGFDCTYCYHLKCVCSYSSMKRTDLKYVVCAPLSLQGKFQMNTEWTLLGVCVCVCILYFVICSSL